MVGKKLKKIFCKLHSNNLKQFQSKINLLRFENYILFSGVTPESKVKIILVINFFLYCIKRNYGIKICVDNKDKIL